MSFRNRINGRLLITFSLSIAGAIVAFGFYFIGTAAGSGVLVRQYLERQTSEKGDFGFTKTGGSLLRGLSIDNFWLNSPLKMPGLQIRARELFVRINQELSVRDIDAAGISVLPVGTSVKAQRCVFKFPLGNKSLERVENGRLTFPSSEPALFFGSQSGGRLNFDVYAPQINLKDVLEFYAKNKKMQNVTGAIHQLNMKITGTGDKPSLTGRFRATDTRYRQFRVMHSLVQFRFLPEKRGKK